MFWCTLLLWLIQAWVSLVVDHFFLQGFLHVYPVFIGFVYLCFILHYFNYIIWFCIFNRIEMLNFLYILIMSFTPYSTLSLVHKGSVMIIFLLFEGTKLGCNFQHPSFEWPPISNIFSSNFFLSCHQSSYVLSCPLSCAKFMFVRNQNSTSTWIYVHDIAYSQP